MKPSARKEYKRKYYQEHREEIIAKVKERHIENWAISITYRKLLNARKKKGHLKDCLQNHIEKVRRIKSRIKDLTYRIEELELVWGKERSERKKKVRQLNANNQKTMAANT